MRTIAPTIYDIAKRANVSKSTVSRVLNQKKNISEKSRLSVLKAIKELNYQPNKIARALTSGFDAILVISRPSNTTAGNPFFTEVIQSITSAAEFENYDVIIQTSKDTDEVLSKCISKINDKMIRGIILLSSPVREDYFETLDKYDIPVAVIGKVERNFKNIFSVDTDNFGNSHRLVQHLVDNGHKDIVCMHSPLKYNAAIDRVKGYKQCLTDNGIEINKDRIIDCGYSLNTALEESLNFLQSTPSPTAVFAVDELKILGLINTASKLDISIPDDISIVCLSNGTTPQLLSPSLTGIELPVYKLGEIATQMLFERIKGIPIPDDHVIVPSEFANRSSVKKVN